MLIEPAWVFLFNKFIKQSGIEFTPSLLDDCGDLVFDTVPSITSFAVRLENFPPVLNNLPDPVRNPAGLGVLLLTLPDRICGGHSNFK